jgi:hypothetical protein
MWSRRHVRYSLLLLQKSFTWGSGSTGEYTECKDACEPPTDDREEIGCPGARQNCNEDEQKKINHTDVWPALSFPRIGEP